MAQAVIIGKGPAGISAALYIARAGIPVTVIGKDTGTLMKAGEIENYYGFSEPVSGAVLHEEGIRQAKRLGIEVLEDEVVGISYDGELVVETKTQQYKADAVVLATGVSRSAPPLKGLKEREGHGVSYCAVCDAFFYRGKDTAVLGSGDYAVHEALELKGTSRSVTILTDGKELTAQLPEGISLRTEPIDSLYGEEILEGVAFKNGDKLAVSGLFVAVGVAGSTDLARKLGAETEGNRILVDQTMATNIPGLYAAGDCVGGLLQIAKAASDGAIAGTSVIKYLRSLKK